MRSSLTNISHLIDCLNAIGLVSWTKGTTQRVKLQCLLTNNIVFLPQQNNDVAYNLVEF